MSTVAITGITGLAGGRVGNALRDAGHVVIGISRRSDAPSTGHTLRIVTDLTDAAMLAEAVAGCDTIFHFADRADRRRYRVNNVGDAATVMAALRTAAARQGIKRVVAASSVYADRDGRCNDLYGQSKRAMEAVGLAPEPGAPAVILRLPPLHGPGARGAIRHIARAVEKGWILPLGLARAPRRFLALDSLANLCVRLVEIDEDTFARARGLTFVPVDGQSASLAALARALGGGRTRLLPVPGVDRLIGGRVTSGQLERDRAGLRDAIGWQASR
ncbi:NAD-dependent epimerase/dehydratase family protein [Sphingomonas sp.]|uniref:NAD-dependent epimerase/dehydratase family protein n=1 Tax=Sphingomonas sp. TaxID=28214 RepID=UPI003AFF639E